MKIQGMDLELLQCREASRVERCNPCLLLFSSAMIKAEAVSAECEIVPQHLKISSYSSTLSNISVTQ
jgi:hypothetical protein